MKKYLYKAELIAQSLIESFITNGKSACFSTYQQDLKENSFSLQKSESIYNGNAGILLFFVELYRVTNKQKYLDVCIKLANWLVDYCERNPSKNVSFLTGRMGVSYALIKIYYLTNDNFYLQSALEIAKKAIPSLNPPLPQFEFLNGVSGTLLAFVHLYAASQQNWLLTIINNLIGDIINHIRYASSGIYWDRSPQYIRGLCGFSHGASGIAFTLLEMGNYFSNPTFYWLAEQAFAYENSLFNYDKNNWPDLRNNIWNKQTLERHRTEFINDNKQYFNTPSDTNTWCHGAAGCGLVRIRAYELFKKRSFLIDAQKAIGKTKQTTLGPNYSARASILCHGIGGNAELFLEMFGATNDKKYLKLSQNAAKKIARLKQQNGSYASGYGLLPKNNEDSSLFMGNAGIGYFFLRHENHTSVPSILSPKIEKKISIAKDFSAFTQISISLPKLRERVLMQIYPRTIKALDSLIPNEKDLFFQQKKSAALLKQSFPKLIKKILAKLDHSSSTQLKQIFNLEHLKILLDESIQSNSYLYMKETINSEKVKFLLSFPDKKLMHTTFILSSEVSIFTSWPSKNVTTLTQTSMGIVEKNLGLLGAETIKQFQTPKTGEKVKQNLIKILGISNEVDLHTFDSKIVEQIRHFILGNFINHM